MSAARPRIGELRERVTLEAESHQESLGGGFVRTSETLGLAWAAVEITKSETVNESGQTRRRSQYEVTIRNRDRVNDIRRILWLGNTLTVTGIIVTRPRGYAKITCEEDAPL